MILVDTSVWIDHLRRSDAGLIRLLLTGQVMTHPFVVGELAMGSLKQRELIVKQMQALPQSVVARDPEVLGLVNREKLYGLGIGFVDAHLLASVRLTAGSRLWTRDKRLLAVAQKMDLAYVVALKP